MNDSEQLFDMPLPARPLVSVIIPVFNQGKYVIAAVNSVLHQTYDNIEVIVVDNCSTDSTPRVLAQLKDQRVRVFQFSLHVIAAVRNFGARQARGEVLAFLDADDEWLPSKLELQLPHLSAGVSCVASDYIPIGDRDACRKLISFAQGEEYHEVSYDHLILENALATSTVILRRTAFEAVAGFDESPEFMLIEDWELWLRLVSERKARILNRSLTKYRVTLNNGRDGRDVAARCLKIIEKHRHIGFTSPKRFDMAVAYRYVNLGKACLEMNDMAGIYYYCCGLLCTTTAVARTRALVGLFLFGLPRPLRERGLRYCKRRKYLLWSVFTSSSQ